MGISYTSNNITFNDVKQVPLTWSGVMGRGENGNFSDAATDGIEPNRPLHRAFQSGASVVQAIMEDKLKGMG